MAPIRAQAFRERKESDPPGTHSLIETSALPFRGAKATMAVYRYEAYFIRL
jgi:hypothetical protein